VSAKKKSLSLRLLFARNLRLVRINAGLSQERLGHECDLDRTFISSVERGVRNISIDNIERISLALNIDAWELLNPDLANSRQLNTETRRSPRRSTHQP
jgi:transcriptional regulator with XRE-family HTH domain